MTRANLVGLSPPASEIALPEPRLWIGETLASSRRLWLRGHLVSPAAAPRSGWRETVIEQRAELRALLDDSPSLQAALRDVIDNELPTAREQAMAAIAARNEQPRIDPAELSFTEDQVRGFWLPN